MKSFLKTVILLTLTFLCLTGAQAQSRKVIYLQKYNSEPYHFGFLLGVNFMDYSLILKDNYQNEIHPKSQFSRKNDDTYGFSNERLDHFRILSAESYTQPGFSVGVIGDKRLGDYFNLRLCPTLSLSSKFVQYETQLYDSAGEVILIANSDLSAPTETTKTVKSDDQLATFLEFPLQIKYRSKRYNNIGAYLIAGVNPKLYLGSIKGTTLKATQNENGETINEGVPAVLQINRTDFAFEFGTGFDIYNQWFKMGVELKFSIGIVNVMKNDSWSMDYMYNAPLEKVRNKQLQLSFTFE